MLTSKARRLANLDSADSYKFDCNWERCKTRENMYRSYSGDGIAYGMLSPEPYVCLGSSHPPLQGYAEMSPVLQRLMICFLLHKYLARHISPQP